jgi:hypothetical protein
MAHIKTRSLSFVLFTGPVVAHTAGGKSVPEKVVPARLPVYEVIKTGVTPSDAEALANHLGIPSKDVLSSVGAVEFVDTARFLVVPKDKVTESKRLEEAIEATRNKDSARQITPAILNVNAINELHALPEESALSKAASAS